MQLGHVFNGSVFRCVCALTLLPLQHLSFIFRDVVMFKCSRDFLLQMLHENLALAIDVTLEHHNAHPILIILGACLSYIRSTLLPPHQHKFACSASSAAPSLECSLCGASGIDSFPVDSASNFNECPDCHARRAGQRVPMRVCDVLGAYALQMLRGIKFYECRCNHFDPDSVLHLILHLTRHHHHHHNQRDLVSWTCLLPVCVQ